MVPTKSGEAHRALERLEDYHADLHRPSDNELKYGIEKIIGIFKTRLFQSLCDIQEFYEKVLMNERIAHDEKVRETKRFAERWENNPPFGAMSGLRSALDSVGGGLSSSGIGIGSGTGIGLGSGTGIGLGSGTAIGSATSPYSSNFDRMPYSNGVDSHATNVSSHSYTFHESRKEQTRDGLMTSEQTTRTTDGPTGYHSQTTSTQQLVDDRGTVWDVEDLVIEKNQTGLGFSISGGIDRVDGDPAIRVTEISPGGAVARDGRVRKHDIILKVNNTDCVNVNHQVAVDALKSSGAVVRLLVKRPHVARSVSQSNLADVRSASFGPASSIAPTSPLAPVSIPVHRVPPEIQRLEANPNVRRLELIKGANGLGFSIAGGVSNQHVPNDNGIYITRIIPEGAAYFDGRLQPMDRIVAVDNVLFENVTHHFAVDTLKNTGHRVTIYYEKNPHPEMGMPGAGPIDDSSRSRTGIDAANRSASLQHFDTQGYGSQSHLAYQPQTPASYGAGDQDAYEPRLVVLRKTDGLGFNIVGGEEGEPVYVSHVSPGGVADLSGQIKKGDVLLQVNDVDLRTASHHQAAVALKNCPPHTPVNLTLQYRPQAFAAFENRVERLRNAMVAEQSGAASTQGTLRRGAADFFVRALFEHDPTRDPGTPHRALAFRYGDILHLVNTNDEDWWTARKVTEAGEESQEGVIPSKKRVEKREKQRRKQVNFNAGSQSLGRGASMGGGLEGRRGSRSQLSFSRKFPFLKSTERLNEFTDNELNVAEEPIFSYETVELQNINYVRPVIMLGALKDRINDELIRQFSDRFSSCVPHTSRPQRADEVHGRDYYFVSKAEMEADVKNNMFIEAGQYHDNLYGTSIKAVQSVANEGRHCILDVSANAVRRLQNTANIQPIAIFVKPHNYQQLKDWEPRTNEDALGQSYDRIQQTEQKFGDLFSNIVTGNSFEDVFLKVVNVINEQSRPRIWAPTRQQFA